MTFTTPTFLIFFPIVFAVYWRFRVVGQNRVLLLASLVFYGWWDWRFLFLLIGVATLDYFVALALARPGSTTRRKLLLAVSLVSNLGTLGFFKYFDFFASSFHDALARFGVETGDVTLHVVLPIGLSFYTFQALSYTIDVYRRVFEPVRSILQYLAYVTFFPQLVAGPIERARSFLPQFAETRQFDYAEAVDGCRQMLWGFFKKMVIADTLSAIVAQWYGNSSSTAGAHLLWATLAFAFQIYCDFSGYSDIAIGSAKLLGIRLMRNFAYPYFARSVPEFWQRWHISLSTWFRDYVYIPLGGNRVGPTRRAINVMIVFVVSGFWHGANFTFLVWGALHGIGYFLLAMPIGDDDKTSLLPSARDAMQMAITFAFAAFAWIFFRAATVTQAFEIIAAIGRSVVHGAFVPPPAKATILVAILVGVEWMRRAKEHPLQQWMVARPIRWTAYYAIAGAVLYLAPLGYTPFIYFQF